MKQNSKRIILAFVISILVTLVALLAYAYFNGDNKPVDGDGGPESSEQEKDEPKNENGASFEYSGNVSIDREAKTIKLYFRNPLRSTRNIVLELKGSIDGKEYSFGKTDQLAPGDKVEQLPLTIEESLPEGRYAGEFVLHFYNSEGAEEIVNSKIKVNLFIR
ncbi:MAG: hypothetical protein K6G36_00395 [Candidatus Saccharibacteria bacterium]|nr:hypothetical protein [Candidatus Saccharibacteria bacterium]